MRDRRNLNLNCPAILRAAVVMRPGAMAGGVYGIFHRRVVRGEDRIEDIVDVQPFMKAGQNYRTPRSETF